jgi:hypothetical protein
VVKKAKPTAGKADDFDERPLADEQADTDDDAVVIDPDLTDDTLEPRRHFGRLRAAVPARNW